MERTFHPLRDPSWIHDDVLNVLADAGAALCVHGLLPSHPWELTTDWAYVRFHGPQARTESFAGRYRGRRLWRVAERVNGWLDAGSDVHAYFNNDIGGAAVADAECSPHASVAPDTRSALGTRSGEAPH